MRLRKSLPNVTTNPLTKSAFYCSVPETLMMHSSARARRRGAPETQTNHVITIKEEE